MVQQLSNEFRDEILAIAHVGPTLSYCYQCGTCSGGCPSFRFTGKFNPRKIIEDVLLGFKEELLNDPVIWLCCVCHECLEHCPQGVLVSELLMKIREIASKIGNIPQNFRIEVETLYNTGQINPKNPAIDRRRVQMGLKEAPSAPVEDYKKIIEITGLIKYMPEKKEAE
ncbi:MAG: 4Fe-4S dicluster domain-containing protein [Candidatus Helarchaeota archaeon]